MIGVPSAMSRPASPPAVTPHRTDIEGLRGVAVLLVVLFHAGVPGFGGGFVGVDVFFVLSGYLITGLLVREFMQHGRINLPEFYARRARRLLPAAALVLFMTILVGGVVFSPLEQGVLARSALATALYLSNAYFVRISGDYFGGALESDPLLHTWSLAVEEQFYLLWPLFLLLALRRKVLLPAMLAVCAVSFVGAVYFTATRQPWAFFGSPLRAWEFAAGGLACVVPVAALRRRPALVSALGWAGLVGILLAGALYTGRMAFPGALALLPVVGTALALLPGSAGGSGIGRVLAHSPLQRMGQWSYSWYLWHWPVLVFATALFPGLAVWGSLLCVAFSLGLAVVTYYLLENPIRSHPRLMLRPAPNFVLAAGLTAFGLTGALGWKLYVQRSSEVGAHRALIAAARDQPRLYADGCDVGAEAGLRECVYGDTSSTSTVVLFGDSHAAHWFPALEQIADRRGLQLVTLIRSACPAADVTVYSTTLGRDFAECDEWRARAVERIRELRPVAVIAASSMGYLRDAPGDDAKQRVSLSEWRDGLRRTLTALDGVPVRLLRDTPRFPENPLTCLSRSAMLLHRDRDCAEPRSSVLPEDVYHTEQAAAAGLANVALVDLTEYFCGSTCEPVRGGRVVYVDGAHITAAYAANLAPALASSLGLP